MNKDDAFSIHACDDGEMLESLQAAADDSPPEYRALIKRYFQAVANRGGKTDTPEKKK